MRLLAGPAIGFLFCSKILSICQGRSGYKRDEKEQTQQTPKVKPQLSEEVVSEVRRLRRRRHGESASTSCDLRRARFKHVGRACAARSAHGINA
ncbi:hypothetical protein EVAR_21067_1 [Eumeta japonica]|uniref:Secreted protein n=1 Tax=Eumeta variegata TaxID=151549 RepID=A0A4C1UZV3_EUMVA|nr:hypothetical protein EVAR_21067_1 [Eumeta japonica]